MAEYWVTKDVQEFYLINATDQQHAENIASKHLHTLYKIVDSEVKDIRVEKKSTKVQVDFINRKNREDMTDIKKYKVIVDTFELEFEIDETKTLDTVEDKFVEWWNETTIPNYRMIEEQGRIGKVNNGRRIKKIYL